MAVELAGGEGAVSSGALAAMRKKEEALRSSYSTLLRAAHFTFREHAKSFTPLHPPSAMSPHLRVVERVWHSMVRHSQPSATHFTIVVDAYGREARRNRIKDLYARWKADQQRSERRGEVDDEVAAPPAGLDPAEGARLQAKEQRATRARLMRETAAGFPVHRSLYPVVKLDTIAYNAIMAAYTSSLAVESLTSTSPALAFPLSLLPSFRPDAKTYSTLMTLHCRMRETATVLQLFDEYQRMRREQNAQLHGQRPLQAVRAERKEEAQYIHSILLRTLGQAGEVEAAERLWEDLKEKAAQGRIALNRPLYHSMLELYASRNAHEKMRAISVEMRRAELALDEDGVCTAIHALCRAGHIDDAVMIHSRLTEGSLGLARPHRKTYLALLSHLCALPSVPFSRVAAVFAEGMEGGWLRSSTAHRQKWIVDLRGIPLPLVEVSLQWHFRSMLSAFMEMWRKEGRKAAVDSIPHRGLLILLGKSRQERERGDQSALRVGLSGVDEEYQPHALSISALDPDAEVGEEAEEEDELRLKPAAAAPVLFDPFATEEEGKLLAQLDDWQVKGSFVQRYVQHLLQQEWPTLRAHLKEDNPASDSTSSSSQPSPLAADAASPPSLLVQGSSTPPSSLLTVRRNEVEFWLTSHAHIRGERAGEGALFPPPRLHGSSGRWMEEVKRRVVEAEEERTSQSGVSLLERLNEWKGKEREALQLKARVFNTKRPPTPLPASAKPRGLRRASTPQPSQRLRVEGEDRAALPRRRSPSRSRLSSPSSSSFSAVSAPPPPPPFRLSRPSRRSSPTPPHSPRPSAQLSSSTLSALLHSPASASLSSRTRATVEEMASRVQRGDQQRAGREERQPSRRGKGATGGVAAASKASAAASASTTSPSGGISVERPRRVRATAQ